MLYKNPLRPPRAGRIFPARSPRTPERHEGGPFLSADDFDRTGILAGVDPCDSRYWWLPDLHEPTTAQGLAPPTGRPSPTAD
jgi:hypothetical protein